MSSNGNTTAPTTTTAANTMTDPKKTPPETATEAATEAATYQSLCENQTLSFPVKLYAILENANYESIISWAPHGRAFVVHDPNQFMSGIAPQFFHQSKYRSFTRQLNIWCFRW